MHMHFWVFLFVEEFCVLIVCFSLVSCIFVDLMCTLILTILLTGTDNTRLSKHKSNLIFTKEFSFIVRIPCCLPCYNRKGR